MALREGPTLECLEKPPLEGSSSVIHCSMSCGTQPEMCLDSIPVGGGGVWLGAQTQSPIAWVVYTWSCHSSCASGAVAYRSGPRFLSCKMGTVVFTGREGEWNALTHGRHLG